ncbi:unnamed protein product [Merluccius merluccius]
MCIPDCCSTTYTSAHPNAPQEDDETMSQPPSEGGATLDCGSPPSHGPHDDRCGGGDPKHHARRPADYLSEPDCGSFPLPHGYAHRHPPHQPTPFPSLAPDGPWGPSLHPSFASSSWTQAGFPSHLASSCPAAKDFSGRSAESASYSVDKFHSMAGLHSPSMGSLEQPYSLRSTHPSSGPYHHTMSPYYCMPPGPACCVRCPPDAFKRDPAAGHQMPMLGPHLPYGRLSKEKNPTNSMQLSLEQRKVFVTYEADNEEHVNMVINFVALLRHNGFDTHIDMFEQQFRSISKIDFMERYLSEKEYLIIIVISPKYYDTVTASPFGLENDERTLNTVYIHKQLQNEFIQNGSKNFRFIPIIFPGAKKWHVPTWLQNTSVFSWPRDLHDILRRLMRVEKYNPPSLGPLPTIISIPI